MLDSDIRKFWNKVDKKSEDEWGMLTLKYKGDTMKEPKEFFVAGVQHHDLHKAISDLEEGDEFTLVPEPTNKYDPNAIKIMADEIMIGYVPKKFSSEVAAALEIGDELICIITHLDPKAKPWEMCKVKIQELDEPDLEDNEGFSYEDDDSL